MARRKQTNETLVDEVVEQAEETVVEELEEICLSAEYSHLTSIVFHGGILEFTDGKAKVLTSAAKKLREQGFID